MSTATKTISANGAIALWELSGPYDRDTIEAVLLSVGITGVRVPERTRMEAIKAALSEVYARRGVMIRPLGDGGFTVVNERANPADLSMEVDTIQGARINSHGELTIRDSKDAERVRDAYNVALTQIDTDHVGMVLAAVIGHLHGVAVRSRGGVYWVPEAGAETWRRLGVALMGMKTGQATLYAVTTVGDSGTVKAITDAFTREADAAADAVERELVAGELGARASAARSRLMAEMVEKAEAYEAILGTALDAVRARLDRVGVDAGRNALMA